MGSKELISEIDFFKETFRMLNNEPRKFEYRLKTHPFDRNQKKLLTAFSYFKKGNKEETFSLLKGYTIETPFFEGVRLYLLGIAHNHYCAYSFAVEHLSKSVEIFQELEEENFLVYSITALILAFGNKRDFRKMEHYVDMMKVCHPSSDHNKLLMIHAELVYLVHAEQLVKAKKILQKTLASDLKNLEMFKPSFLILYFSAAFKSRNYSRCYEILDEYKALNGFTVKLNYLYMKCLLDHITAQKPLYVYESDYKDFPEMHHQLEVIKSLSVGDVERAGSFWSLLQKHNPSIYKKDFTYAGDYSLFSCALGLYAAHAKTVDLDLNVLNGLSGPLAKLQYIFSQTSAAVPKEELIKLIWNENSSEASLNRLRQLVYSYKKKYRTEIVSHQNTYKMDKAS
jgi:hypothetical protein